MSNGLLAALSNRVFGPAARAGYRPIAIDPGEPVVRKRLCADFDSVVVEHPQPTSRPLSATNIGEFVRLVGAEAPESGEIHGVFDRGTSHPSGFRLEARPEPGGGHLLSVRFLPTDPNNGALRKLDPGEFEMHESAIALALRGLHRRLTDVGSDLG